MSITINDNTCEGLGRIALYYRGEALYYAAQAEEDRRFSEEYMDSVDFLDCFGAQYGLTSAADDPVNLTFSYRDTAQAAETKSAEFVRQFHRYNIAYQSCLAAERETIVASVINYIVDGLFSLLGI
jgi:hypothetical protein